MRSLSLAMLGVGLCSFTALAQESSEGSPSGKKPWLSELPPLPEIEPITRAQIDASIKRGVDFLISSQNKNGSWGAATMTKGLNISAPIPGAHHAFRAGSTGLALQGLLLSEDRRPETVAAIDKAEAWFLKELPRLRRATVNTMYNVWGHSYGISALCELYTYPSKIWRRLRSSGSNATRTSTEAGATTTSTRPPGNQPGFPPASPPPPS
jgi:hypothetical protein